MITVIQFVTFGKMNLQCILQIYHINIMFYYAQMEQIYITLKIWCMVVAGSVVVGAPGSVFTTVINLRMIYRMQYI